MSTILKYCDQVILSGQPTPSYTESTSMVRYGERWHQQKDISLKGQITGCTYTKIINAQLNLITLFNKDFQPFEIISNGKSVEYSPITAVKSIDFTASRYVGILDYSVSLNCLPPNYFSGYYGVINPVNSWEFSETAEKTIEITHTVSAKGFNTTSGFSNALNNAKNFVYQNSGLTSFVYPVFMKLKNINGVFLTDGPNEQINRFEGTYSVTEKYLADIYNGKNPSLRYSTTFDCDKNGTFSKLSLNGSIKAGINEGVQKVRDAFQATDFFSLAVDGYKNNVGDTHLNPDFLSRNVSENILSNQIDFSFTYDNDFRPKIYFDYETEITKSENDITTISLNGAIKGRGNLKGRYELVESYFNLLNLYQIAQEEYNNFENQLYPLNTQQESYSVTFNKFVGEISVSVTYTNKPIYSSDFKDLDYTLSWTCPLLQVKATPLIGNRYGGNCLTAKYCITDLNYLNRASFSIKGNFVGKCEQVSGIALFQNQISSLSNNLYSQYFINTKSYLEQNQLSYDYEGQWIGGDFSFQWSAQALSSISNNYKTINKLVIT